MDENKDLEKDVEIEEKNLSESSEEELDNESFTYKIDNNNVGNDYNRNSSSNGSIMYIIAGAAILILIIVFLVIVANKGSKKAGSYSKVESDMISAAKSYYKKNVESLPTTDGGYVTVSADTLIENSYLKPFSEMVDKGVSCSGNVKVYKIGEEYSYFPYLNCGSDYESVTLSKKISSSIVTSGDGLYLYGDRYIFRGEYPNNYIKFNDSVWRIIGINNDGSVKMVFADKKAERYAWDDRYNSEKDGYYGINNFRVSRILQYLERMYEKNLYVDKDNRGLLVKHDWCIGKVSQSGVPISSLSLCNDVYSDLYIGAVQIDDVLLPSLDSKCTSIYDTECTNYNYFYTINTGWTLNACADDTFNVFNSVSGTISYKRASNENFIRPVINLNSDVLYKSGTGTSEDPYVIVY